MTDVVHRITKEYRRSVHTPDYSLADWIHNPDLSAVVGQPAKYWLITGDVISLMDQAARDAVDAQELSDRRDSIISRLDDLEILERAELLALLDDRNIWADWLQQFKDGVATANNLADIKSLISRLPNTPQGGIAQMKTKIRNKLGS